MLLSYLCVYVLHTFINFIFIVFFFKQKTAYEMRISDWSSDVCSSDLSTLPFTIHHSPLTPSIKASLEALVESLVVFLRVKLLLRDVGDDGAGDRKSVV